MAHNYEQRVRRGLLEYNLALEDLKTWKYIGGRPHIRFLDESDEDREEFYDKEDRHYRYFLLCGYTNADFPTIRVKCVCGHRITNQCFIADEAGVRKIVLGNCCIKRFIPKNGRSCSTCGGPHKNRVVNRCNDCRVGVCDGCDVDIDKRYKKCYTCC
jgi:hypothetical protein